MRISVQPGMTLGLRLLHKTPWAHPTPFLTLTTDASNVGWGYHSFHGHQGQGMWPDSMTSLHINTKELTTVSLTLRQVQEIRGGPYGPVRQLDHGPVHYPTRIGEVPRTSEDLRTTPGPVFIKILRKSLKKCLRMFLKWKIIPEKLLKSDSENILSRVWKADKDKTLIS